MNGFLSPYFLKEQQQIAVGISGGPDSTALTHMLCDICEQHNFDTKIHALIVNHDLREDSLQEAEQVKSRIEHFYNITVSILTWEHDKQSSRIMELARNARYELMSEHCRLNNIQNLYIGHHQDDQAETFLFRLCKGSGLDGLGAMRESYNYSKHVNIMRPLLSHTKADLIEYCAEHNLDYINDPSNYSEDYARPRLRKVQDYLSEEGLTSKRLYKTAQRLLRARDALDYYCNEAIKKCVSSSRDTITIYHDLFMDEPEEIALRVLQKMISKLYPDTDYSPRMEKLETILEDIIYEDNFRKRTFAHIIFERTSINGRIVISMTKEK